MGAEQTIEDELRDKLEELARCVQMGRDRGEDENEIFQHCDELNMTSHDRLNDYEIAELRGCKRGLDAAAQEFHLQSRMESYMRDVAALPAMTREEQIAYWDGNRPNYDFTLLAEERDKMTKELYDTARAQIQNRYTDLREGMSRAIDNIRDGNEPALDFLIESQIEREAEVADRAKAMPWQPEAGPIAERKTEDRKIKRSL